MLVIRQQILQAPQGAVLLVGDSTAERFYLPTLCGLPVLNTGVGRETARDALAISIEAKAAIHPRFIVASIGMNDVHPAKAAQGFAQAFPVDYLVAPSFGSRPDGKHLTTKSYHALKRDIEDELCPFL